MFPTVCQTANSSVRSTKIHLAADALGNAVRFILTGGERNDITQAESLVKDLYADDVIADKGYDAEAFVLKLKERNLRGRHPFTQRSQSPTKD